MPHPSQRSQAGGEAQEAGDAPADPGAPLPLAFMVRLLAPDGGHGLDPALMEPLQLRFSRQIQVGPCTTAYLPTVAHIATVRVRTLSKSVGSGLARSTPALSCGLCSPCPRLPVA